MATTADLATAVSPPRRLWALPSEASIILVLIGIAVIFEILGWTSKVRLFLAILSGC